MADSIYTNGTLAKLYRRVPVRPGDCCLVTVGSEDGGEYCGRPAKYAVEILTSRPDGSSTTRRSVACKLEHLKRDYWRFFQEVGLDD